MLKVPCEFKESKDVNGVKRGYRVTIYQLIVESNDSLIPFVIHSFTSQSDALDNALFAIQCGFHAEVQRTYIYVSPRFYSTIYNLIESYVSQANSH